MIKSCATLSYGTVYTSHAQDMTCDSRLPAWLAGWLDGAEKLYVIIVMNDRPRTSFRTYTLSLCSLQTTHYTLIKHACQKHKGRYMFTFCEDAPTTRIITRWFDNLNKRIIQ